MAEKLFREITLSPTADRKHSDRLHRRCRKLNLDSLYKPSTKAIPAFRSSLAGTFDDPIAVRASDDSRFSIYDLPESLSRPCDLCDGPDGALWGQDQLRNSLFRIDPNTSDIESFTIPFTLPPIINTSISDPLITLGRTAFSCAIRPGADGNIYSAFGTRNQLVRINPSTKKISIFTPDSALQPLGNLQPLNDLYSSPDGAYFTQSSVNLISFFNFSTESITSIPIPTPASFPLGMFFASDGNAYFTELLANKIGRLHPTTNEITAFDLPVPGLLGPAVIRAERDGYIYFAAFPGNAIGRLSITNGSIDVFSNPSVGTFAAEDAIDGDGGIWFSSATQNLLDRLDPETGVVTSVEMPGTVVARPVSVPLYTTVAMNYGPGNAIWFTEELAGNGRVGRYSLD